MKNETLHIRLKANMRKGLTNIKAWTFLTMFILLGAIVPQEAKANYDSRGVWYFDNTNTNWSNVYLIVGRGDWTQAIKMELQQDNIYKAESSWDNTYAFFFASSTCGYSTGSGSAKDIVGSRSGNYTSNFTSKPSNNYFTPSQNGTNITGTWSAAYYLKHPWGTGSDNDWSWKLLKYNNGIYTLKALYASGKGCNYSKPNSTDEAGYVSNPTLEGSPTTGDECIFTFNPSNNTITITKVVTCDNNPDFSVSLSKSEVAVGCTDVTASITGDDSQTVTVTWSSSNPSVATINSSTGAITIKAAGTTTIKATTTEANGFCGGVEKPATLTVKSPSVTVKANDNSLCESETLTLTATLTNCGAGNSIQWYKGDNPIVGEASATLTISSVTTANSGNYKAVVSGGILCSSVESTPITITVNPLPSAPSLSNPEPICYGTPFTLPEKDDNKKPITWNVNNRELTNLSVGTHTYTAKIVENGCESTTVDYTITVKEQLAIPVLEITNVKQCGINYTAGEIVISNHNPNNTYILKKDGNTIDKTYNNGYSISENEVGTYTVEVSKDGACGATSVANIEVINNTPTVTPFEITKQANVCMGNPVTLSYDGTAQSGTISYAWYEGDSEVVIGTESTLTIQQAKNATYKLVVTVTSNDCPASAEATTIVEPKAVPSAPTFDVDEMDVCENQQFTLPMPNNLKYEEQPLWTVNDLPTTASQTIKLAGDYTYTAYKNDGCPSEGTDFTVHVNPLPAITGISVNNSSPVINEDVLLTVEGSDIARVEWSITSGNNASLSDASGNSVKLTSTASGAVTVTATAISDAGCTSATTKTVTFGEETCEPTTITVPVDYIEIYCKYKDAPTQHDMKVDIWKESEGQGTESYQSCSKSVDGYAYWKFNITDDATYCIRISNKEINYKSGSMCTLTRGHKYYFDIPGGWSGWKDGPDESKTQDITETQDGPPAVTAPAVKTVSATSEEGSGIVTFTGKILKTGCANGSAIWVGYQYKKANEEWPTSDVTAGSGVKQLVSIANNPGLEDFTAEVDVENLDDGDYHFRAYIINGYNFTNGNYDQGVYYGLDKLVTVRNTKTAIISVALQHADEYGNPILSTPTYCAGTTAYLLLTYDGSRPDEVNWSSTLSNTITKVDGDLYQFTVAGSETITVSAKNEENIDFIQGTIEVAAYSIPLTPMVELDKSEICSNDEDGATITVTNAQDGIQYYLYETGDDEAVQGPITGTGSLAFTGIKTAATYYVSAVNSNCPTYKVESQKRAITVIDASQNTIAIEPTTKTINPWGTVTLNVTKNSQYDYTLKCMQEDTDVTANLVINKKGDTYSIKFPKPSTAKIVDGQVTFSDIIYIVTVTLDGSVQCGTTSATSEITLTQLVEDCD